MIDEKKTIFAYLVSKLNEKTEQVGKTTIQKMMYFLKRKGLVDYEYTLYHYGPYSFEVEGELIRLESTGIIDVSWDPDRGYFIRLAEGYDLAELETGVKEAIDFLVEKFGQKRARDLSLIATVLYFYGRLSESEIIETVKSLKPQFSELEVRKALEVVKEIF
mgnify:CR=1 FL=1